MNVKGHKMLYVSNPMELSATTIYHVTAKLANSCISVTPTAGHLCPPSIFLGAAVVSYLESMTEENLAPASCIQYCKEAILVRGGTVERELPRNFGS